MQHPRPSARPVALTLLLVVGCLNGQDTNASAVPPAPAAAPAAATAIPTNDTYNLRGTPVQGTTRRSELSFDIQDAQLTMKVGDAALSGVMSIKSEATEELEILEVGDGLVREGRLHHVLDKTTNTIGIKLPGTEHSEPTADTGVLHGRVETIEFIGGQWKRTLEGAPPTPEQALELTSPPIDDAMYPTAIKIGESWTESGPELRRWLTSDVRSVRGEVKNTLIAVESQQGDQVAVIESAGEAEATIVDADNNELTMTLALQGTIRRSLDRGIDVETAAEGTVRIAGDVAEEGVTMSLTVSGRFSAKLRGSLR